MEVDALRERPVATKGRDVPRVAVVPERYGNVLSPCASIRLVPFFDALRVRGLADVHYVLPSEIRRLAPDVIVWHRVSVTASDEIERLAEAAAASGARLVYDLDDNLLDLTGHAEEDAYRGMVSAVKASLAIADLTWVSTPRLGARVSIDATCEVETMQNAIDPDLWPQATREISPGTVGNVPLQLVYMGTRTHEEDFSFLVGELDRVNQMRPGTFELTVIGVRSGSPEGPKWIRYREPPSHVGASYPAFVAWFSALTGFDVGVAPLLSSPFNDCKSHIKVLDYAAIGLPTLASDMPAYAEFLQSGSDCLLAANEEGAWAGCLLRVIDDFAQMRTIGNNVRRLVSRDAFEWAFQRRARSLGCK